MKRIENWQCALSAFLAEREELLFRYGQHDCCLFACDAVAAITGVDVGAVYRNAYQNRTEAMKAVSHQTGVRSIRAAAEKVTKAHAMPQLAVLTAQRGDVVMIRRGVDYSLGIVDLTGAKIAVAAARGLLRVDLQFAIAAWRV